MPILYNRGMIMTLTGENSFALRAQLRKLTGDFIEKYGDLAVEQLDGEETSFEKMQEALTSLPFLASQKMVVLSTPGANKQFAERLEQILPEIPETTYAILVEPKLDKRGSYYKLLKKQTDFQEYTRLDERALAKWAVTYAKEQGAALSLTDATYLIARIGTGQQRLSREIEKLAVAAKTINKQTIDELTEASPQSTIFELIDAAFSGNAARAMKLYDEQRALKVEPQQIIAMLTWQLHVLAVIKAAGERSPDTIAREAKLSPYTVRKSSSVARHLSFAELKHRIKRLAELDAASKRTSIDLDEAVRTYILSL